MLLLTFKQVTSQSQEEALIIISADCSVRSEFKQANLTEFWARTRTFWARVLGKNKEILFMENC